MTTPAVLRHANGTIAKVGDLVTSFRGEQFTLTGWAYPKHPSSTGRIYVRSIKGGSDQEFFPSVCGLCFYNFAPRDSATN